MVPRATLACKARRLKSRAWLFPRVGLTLARLGLELSGLGRRAARVLDSAQPPRARGGSDRAGTRAGTRARGLRGLDPGTWRECRQRPLPPDLATCLGGEPACRPDISRVGSYTGRFLSRDSDGPQPASPPACVMKRLFKGPQPSDPA